MADNVDTAPTTSYSDPIYDRLELLGQRVHRAKWAIIVAIVLAVVLGIGTRTWLNNRPEAKSAVAFVKAENERDAAKRREAFEAVANDATTTGFFRARAALELVQMELLDGKTDEAATWAAKASTAAQEGSDDQLLLVCRLAKAAVAEDTGKLDDAFTDYEAVERSGMALYPSHGLTGALGAARIELVQDKAADAMARLEPYIARDEAELDQILGVVRLLYWQAKRSVDGQPVTIPDPNAPAPAVAPVAEQPAAEAAPVEAAPAEEAAPVEEAAPAEEAAQPAAE